MTPSRDDDHVAPAARHLLACLNPTAGSEATLNALSAAEWIEVVRLARNHRISVLLQARLKSRALDQRMPPAASQLLASFARRAIVRSLRLRRELGRVLRALAAADIAGIVLKGAHLANTVYEHPALREMVDLDILVVRQDLARAAAVVASLGFKPTGRFLPETDAAVHQHIAPLRRDDVAVELHWTLTPPNSGIEIRPPDVWRRAAHIEIDQVPTRVLCAEDLLLHLCVHAAHHHYFALGLRAILDIDAVAGRGRIDWPRVVSLSRECHAERGVRLTLLMAKELLGADIPESIIDAARSDCGIAIRRVAESRLTGSAVGVVPDAAARIAANANRWSTFRVALRQLFSPKHVAMTQRVSLRSPWLMLAYPARLLDVLRRHGLTGLEWAVRSPLSKKAAQAQHQLAEWLAGSPTEG